jgi:glycopeptide antibiotics resistance protein
MMDKRGQFETFWLEYVAGAFLIVAFYLAARGAYVGITYVVVAVIGAILGKFWYDIVRKKKSRIHITAITLAVLLGMLLGAIGADRMLVVVLYALGLLLSYVAHKERWIRTI